MEILFFHHTSEKGRRGGGGGMWEGEEGEEEKDVVTFQQLLKLNFLHNFFITQVRKGGGGVGVGDVGILAGNQKQPLKL